MKTTKVNKQIYKYLRGFEIILINSKSKNPNDLLILSVTESKNKFYLKIVRRNRDLELFISGKYVPFNVKTIIEDSSSNDKHMKLGKHIIKLDIHNL